MGSFIFSKVALWWGTSGELKGCSKWNFAFRDWPYNNKIFILEGQKNKINEENSLSTGVLEEVQSEEWRYFHCKTIFKIFSSPISTPTYTIKDSLFLELLSKIRYEPSTVWAEPAPSGRILPNKMSGMARTLSLHSKLKGWVLSWGNTET